MTSLNGISVSFTTSKGETMLGTVRAHANGAYQIESDSKTTEVEEGHVKEFQIPYDQPG
ncbi:hypothetical protein BO99DRAFT_429628 [Aspergillus violaceofuscus CBS 115571]|uniref:Uncharacterized protein n=1 Tax=Aspergillus violaceofuscus (strain CBS 115571) TaxID=1450538 RepID=A0A2V5HKY0_ASPV1|nr:hypothetical protein BO99DRAFT_429628 [Aspergillus violaceofuscus CBS 115571]